MAHCEKYKLSVVAPMFAHYERTPELERNYERSNIDPARTSQNYNLCPCDAAAKLQAAIAAHREAVGRAFRADGVAMFDWIVTAPEDLPEGETRRFFNAVLAFIKRRYGEQNVLGGFVHLDETTPHIHVPVLPQLEDGRLGASKMVNRADLQTFHRDLSAYVDAELGFHTSITLDESRQAEKELSKLDQGAYKAAKRKIADKECELADLERRIEREKRRLESLRRNREATAERVEVLAPLVEKVHEFDHARGGERRRLAREICDRATRAMADAFAAIERIQEAVKVVVGPVLSGRAPKEAPAPQRAARADREHARAITAHAHPRRTPQQDLEGPKFGR